MRAKILRDEGSSFIFIENNKKRWELSASQNKPSAQTDENQPEIPKGRLLLDRLRSSLNRQKSNRISASQQASGEAVQQQEPSKLRRTQTSLISKWVNGRKVFTEKSPEIQKFRTDLKENGTKVPDYTRLCLHAERTETAEGKEVISITSQGTLANRNAQKDILKWVKDYFVVDGKRVVIGGSPGSHENDHVVYSSLSDIFNLRHPSPTWDRGSTVKLPKNIHAIRTNNPELKELRFDLKDLKLPLPRILDSIYKADKNLWMREEHADAINKAGLTPEFLVNQYAFAHKVELGRMTCDLKEDGFHPKQATAFLVDRLLDASITLSTDNFIYFEPTPPVLELEDESVLSTFTSHQVERANRCYFKKMRLHNVFDLAEHFANYTKLAHTLELYSQSPEGEADGCNTFQTQQHRETKMKAIHSFEEALQEGKTLETETKEALNKMLVLATVDKDGNSTEGLLPIEEVKDRISKIGGDLQIDYLYKRRSVFSMREPKIGNQRTCYKECVKNAARKPRNASIVPEQESSDQDYIFLD